MSALDKLWHGLIPGIALYKQIRQNKPIGFSFNLTDRCPIGCNCYWRSMNRVTELPDNEVINFFKARQAEGMILAAIVGGEPYVRPNLLEEVVQIMPANWVITSGTTRLRKLNKTTHFISIDGKDAKTHNTIRRSEGLYERILKNIEQAKDIFNYFPVFIHTVLNSYNYTQAQEIIKFWHSSGLADGILFSLYTNIGNTANQLSLTSSSRQQIVKTLLDLKLEYGNYLCLSPSQIKHFSPEITEMQNPQTCPTAQHIRSYHADGQIIPQCIFGPKGNCNNCGCVITPLARSLTQQLPTLGVLYNLSRLYTPPHNRR